MATGDIKSVAVNTDGWSVQVVVEGWATRAGSITYDFGSFDDTPATITDPKMTFTVVSQGYSASGVLGTITRTVYGTHVVRKAHPDQTQKNEADSAADITIRVALSESIYDDDKNAAGGSLTDPVVTVAAGWATYGGTPTPLTTAMTVTNNSTLDYPKCIAQWAWGHTPTFRRVTAAFDIGCIAYHGHGIACVALSATDAHAAAVSGTVTSKTDHAVSASGLHYESYDLAVPVTSFTEGDDITLRFIAYPLVGDADSIVDTSVDTASTNIAKGNTQITCTYKASGVVTKYVSSAGNDTTGDGSSGTPYATIGKALAQSPDVILVKSGSSAIATLGATPASVTAKNYCIEVMPEAESITLNRTSTAYLFKARHLRYSGFTIASAGEAYSLENSTAYTLQFADCSITRTGALPTQGPGNSVKMTLYTNCSWDGRDKWDAAAGYNFAMAGCNVIGGDFRAFHSQVASKFTGTGTADQMNWLDRTGGLIQSNYIFAHNKIINAKQSGSGTYRFGNTNSMNNAAFIGNVVEVTTAGAPQAFSWFEASTNTASDSTILAHNTVIGARSNIYYNDVGAAAVMTTNAFVRNNAFESFNIKSDTFATANGARVGNWSAVNAVNFSDNRWDGTAGFPCDWDGINVAYVNAEDTTFGQLGYTDDNSADGDGTGNGDYMPTEASVLYDHTLLQAYQSYDLYGTAL